MFDGAFRIFRSTLTVLAVLVVLYVVGVVNVRGSTGMNAVADGLAAVLRAAGALISRVLHL